MIKGKYTIHIRYFCISYVPTRDGNGPGRPRAGSGWAGPENPGPRALRAETGLKIFYLRVLCAT